MTTTVAIAAAAAITAGGPTQDFTSSGFGTPKACIVTATLTTAAGTAVNSAAFSFGATDGTNSRCSSAFDEHAQNPTDSYNRGQTTVLCLLDGTGAVVAQASFSAWITDGVRLTWSTLPGTAVLVRVVLFGGTDLQAFCGEIVPSSSISGTTVNTSVGFQSDLVIAFSQRSRFDNANRAEAKMSLGVAVRTPAFQGSQNWDSVPAVTPSQTASYIASTRLLASISGGALGSTLELTTWSSTGFTITTRDVAESIRFSYLALQCPGIRLWGGVVSTPTATGTNAITTPAMKPALLGHFGGLVDTIDSLKTDAQAGTIGAGWAVGTGSVPLGGALIAATSISAKDNSATSDTQSLTSTKAVDLPSEDGSAGLTATLTSFDSGGYTLNWSAVLGTARKHVAFIIGPNPSTVTPTVPAFSVSAPSPVVDKGTKTVTPTVPGFAVSAPSPAVTFGTLRVTPTVPAFAVSAPSPAVNHGTKTCTPTAAGFSFSAPSPAVNLGTLRISPTVAAFSVAAPSPVLLFGTKTITPTVPSFQIRVPVVTFAGSYFVHPTLAQLRFVTRPVSPVLVFGTKPLTPTPAVFSFAAVSPKLGLTATLAPTPAVFSITAPSPVVDKGTKTIAPPVTGLRFAVRAVDPAVQIGTLIIQPTLAQLRFVTRPNSPAVVHGTMTVTPTAAGFSVSAPSPAVVLGVKVVPASPVAFVVSAPTPARSAASITIQPTLVGLRFVTRPQSPNVMHGELVLTPTPAVFSIAAPSPTFAGTMLRTPTPLVFAVSAPSPAVSLGTLTRTPTPAVFAVAAPAPAVHMALSIVPTPAVFSVAAPAPALAFGTLTIAPTLGGSRFIVRPFSVTLSTGLVPAVFTPTPAVFSITVPAVSTSLGTATLTPTPAAFAVAAVDPTVVFGLKLLRPAPVGFALSAVGPLVSNGTLGVQVATASFVVAAPAPAVVFGTAARTPTPAVFSIAAPAPTVVHGVGSKLPTPAVFSIAVPAVTVTTSGAITLRPSAARATFRAPAPRVIAYDYTLVDVLELPALAPRVLTLDP